jgi:hypothetical protein
MKIPLWLVKILKYEYWTWWFFYIPVLPYWLWLALKSRSFTYFTAANPGIEAGGFFGESKIDILNKIPAQYKPKTIFIEKNENLEEITFKLLSNGIGFPLIAKPNIGERGNQVEKIENAEALQKYIEENQESFIIQEFIDFEIEMGVMFYRLPSQPSGKVSSVTLKKFLSVTGNGKNTIEELINQSVRARFQYAKLQKKLGEKMQEILPENESLLLEPIGNHCRGTMFLNGNHLINDTLHKVFNEIALPVDGFYYGRFDMKVKSLEDLYEGKNIRIMELNGVSAEPAHIYDPQYTLLKAYRDLLNHWKIIYQICRENMQNGIKPVPVRELWQMTRGHFLKTNSIAENQTA